jgi:hypothetical protein
MEPEDALPCSQKLDNASYTKTQKFSLHPRVLLKDPS